MWPEAQWLHINFTVCIITRDSGSGNESIDNDQQHIQGDTNEINLGH